MRKIRMRLGGRADLREPFLGKPERMHWLFGEWGEKNLRDFSRNAGTQPPTLGTANGRGKKTYEHQV
jgi:hypothetical protein